LVHRNDYREQASGGLGETGPESDEGGVEAVPETREAMVREDWHGERIDKLLTQLAPEFSRSHLQQLIQLGHVRVAGVQEKTPSRRLRAGDALAVDLVPTEQSRAFRPEAVAFDIVHEDAHVLVIDKRAGLVVHPGAGNWSGTLLNGLLHRDPRCAALPRAGIVHRLDKDTSGLMVVARTTLAYTALVRDIARRDVRREYLALVHGAWERRETVEAPIGRDPAARIRMAVVPGGRPARTDFEPLSVGAEVSAVRCVLHSGRTHQIRVHAAHLRHPLVADPLYGGRCALGLARQALHAHRLAFQHPASGQRLSFQAALPQDMACAWAAAGGP
jgi:23S rRNA pseudouridine1911/1915/1917 synthase